MRKAVRLADANIPLLVQGETGVGKGNLRASCIGTSRSDKPFVAINCAALPGALIESELFGYADGAFTGARRQGRKGLIEQADGGILFSRRIGDMPLAMQSRLLRVLGPRGDAARQQATKVDFLPVTATHRPLKALVETGQFRPDLCFPAGALRHRTAPALRTLEGKAGHHRRAGGSWGAAPKGSFCRRKQRLVSLISGWPGNFRQLAATLCGRGAGAGRTGAVVNRRSADGMQAAAAATGFAERLDDITDEAIRRRLRRAGGNVSKAAGAGVDRSTLYRR